MSANTGDREHTNKQPGEDDADRVRAAFSKLPLDEKLLTLMRIEVDMLGDAVETVASAVSTAVDEIVDACAGKSAAETPGAADKAPAT